MKLPILSFHFGVTCFARGGKTKKREAKEKVSLVDKCRGGTQIHIDHGNL